MAQESACSVSGCPSAGPTLHRRHFQPYGSLARTLYNKQLNDEELKYINRKQWYRVDQAALPQYARDAFYQLDADADTEAFLQEAQDKSECIFTQIWHSICRLLLGWLFTQTSLNGLLGRGSMFVFSTAQIGMLLERSRTETGGRLLDLGAGDGAVTERMAPLFDEIFTTEISGPMRRVLARKNFKVLDIEEWVQPGSWDVVSCLNVLDRCSQPNQLLADIRRSLTVDGKAVIALVLPYRPYVEVGGAANHQPEEHLPIQGETFEEQAASVIKHVLEPSGFTVNTWTRLPYLCEGDLNQAYYWLFDAVFVVSPKPFSFQE